MRLAAARGSRSGSVMATTTAGRAASECASHPPRARAARPTAGGYVGLAEASDRDGAEACAAATAHERGATPTNRKEALVGEEQLERSFAAQEAEAPAHEELLVHADDLFAGRGRSLPPWRRAYPRGYRLS